MISKISNSYFKIVNHSLFLRLFFSFLLIIGLLVSFTLESFSIFKGNIQDQILKYNNLNLNNTTEAFETNFQTINDLALNFYLNEKVQNLNVPEMDYVAASQMIRDLQSLVLSHQTYLDNIMINYKKSSFVITKDRGTSISNMFTRFYYSPQYPLQFWDQQFNEKASFRIYPAADFSEQNYNNYSSLGVQFPIVIKSYINPNFYIVAFLNARNAVNAYHKSINNSFVILDQQGKSLFSSTPIDIKLPAFTSSEGYIKQGKSYYFYKKGPFTDLTYVNIIADQHIASQISKLNLTLFVLLIVSIVISVFASILFSMGFNNPVKKLIESIQQFNPAKTMHSHIKEFEIINKNIGSMMKTNHEISQDLTRKNSFLQQYALTNQLKKIHMVFQGVPDLSHKEKPYVIVLYQVIFKHHFNEEIKEKTERATYYIREFIHLKISERYSEAYNFQIENDQILSAIFLNDNDRGQLYTVLEEFKKIIEMDQIYYFLTIAVSSMKNDLDFTSAYAEVLHLAEQRLYNDQTEIIIESKPKSGKMLLTETQEHEFSVNLNQGNETEIIEMINRILMQMKKREASATQFLHFGEEIIHKALRKLAAINLNIDSIDDLDSPYGLLKSCHTVDELALFFEEFLTRVAHLIKEKREEHDPVINFVFDYFEHHFAEEITLEAVADKLNISSSYLSTYFKEKTGKNFIDFLNEIRIDKAKESLLYSATKIKDISIQSGYQNLNSFHRMFKRFTGMTPNQFRKNHHLNSDI